MSRDPVCALPTHLRALVDSARMAGARVTVGHRELAVELRRDAPDADLEFLLALAGGRRRTSRGIYWAVPTGRGHVCDHCGAPSRDVVCAECLPW